MQRKKQTDLPTRNPSVPVRCKECVHALQFIENSCYCRAMDRRVCSCDRYGRVCKYYSTK